MKPDHEESIGNVFADLGFRNPEQELLKAKLTLQIHKLLKEKGLTQEAAAKRLGTRQPHVSALMSLRPVSISVGRLMEFLTVFGQDVEVVVKPAKPRRTRRGHCQSSCATHRIPPDSRRGIEDIPSRDGEGMTYSFNSSGCPCRSARPGCRSTPV
jgi:predicted XRE-type DNA-binding protein